MFTPREIPPEEISGLAKTFGFKQLDVLYAGPDKNQADKAIKGLRPYAELKLGLDISDAIKEAQTQQREDNEQN